MTNTTIKPLTPLMTAMLLEVADKGVAKATGRQLITLRALVERGLVVITKNQRARDKAYGRCMVYTTTDAGMNKAIELV